MDMKRSPSERDLDDTPSQAKKSAPNPQCSLLARNMEAHSGPYKFKTKIVCTLGPACRELSILKDLLRSGMNVARFNFSHGSHEYHQETLDMLRAASEASKIPCAVLLDTKGPEIRTGMLEDGKPIMLERNKEITLTTDYSVVGNESLIACSYPNLARDVSPGSMILAADGSITLKVVSADLAKGTVLCRCENSAKLGERKNMNLPGVIVDLPTITAKDTEDILEWGVKNKVDFIAASFVRKGSDLTNIRKVLGEAGKNIHLISKIENEEGLDNFEAILDKSDGIMVARGDLGMEIPMEKIFMVQKRMINMCNLAGKPVITATQMLESMTANPRPTRAEATDVANAVLDGTDCVMLSGETAAGPYPVEAVKIMSSICEEAESFLDYSALFQQIMSKQVLPMSTIESLASSAVRASDKVDAKLMIVMSRTGRTAKLVAKYRPSIPVLMVAIPDDSSEASMEASKKVLAQCLGVRGIIPILAPTIEGEGRIRKQMAAATDYAKKTGLVHAGDKIVGIHKVEADAIMRIVDIN